MDIFGGSTQNWIIFRGNFYAFQGTEWVYFGGMLKFQICFGVLEISDIFRGGG